jgi:hypothetical protein
VNVYWEKAPDRRSSRTLDWLNDACEAKLGQQDRDRGKPKYTVLLSPVSTTFRSRGAALSFDRKLPFIQANRAKLRLGRGEYTRTFPISVLLTEEFDTTGADRETRQVQPYVLLGTQRRPGRRAKVRKYERVKVTCDEVKKVRYIPHDPARRAVDHFQCMLHVSRADLDVRFATKSEADALFECLNARIELKAPLVKSGP